MNGAFKGRGRSYLTLLACPVDGAGLRLGDGAAHCAADPAHVYPYADGILRLVTLERRAELDRWAEQIEAERAGLGWHVPDEADFKALPQTGIPGYPENYWGRQAAATALLWRFLEAIRHQRGGLPVGPQGEAAVIGAGMGWLAYGLDVAGYTTLAIDALAGRRYGLGVYPYARYCRVQADLARPPLARDALDVLVYQEGLVPPGEDNGEAQGEALSHALRSLRPGGWLMVIDALDRFDDDPAEVHTLLDEAGLVLMAAPRRQGWRGRLLELRDRLAGRERGVPPVLVAHKPAR